MNWEGSIADKLLVVRGADKKPMATVAVPGDGTAFATVTCNGQTYRKQHADVLLAQAWCAGVLAGKPCAPTYEAPDKSKAVIPARSQPVKPKGTPLERLLAVLREDPNLAWEVCQGAKALGPWVAAAGETFVSPNADGTDSKVKVDWFQRTDATGFNVATVRLKAEKDGGWLWSEFVPGSVTEIEVMAKGQYENSQQAKDACDEYLRSRGWLLAIAPV